MKSQTTFYLFFTVLFLVVVAEAAWQFSIQKDNLFASRRIDAIDFPITASSKQPETSGALFSDPESDVTFQYPQSWSLEKKLVEKELPHVRAWQFHEGEVIKANFFSPIHETSFDACSTGQYAYLHSFGTNDPSTNVLAEVCAACEETTTSTKNCFLSNKPATAYIYWVRGIQAKKQKDLLSNVDTLSLIRFELKSDQVSMDQTVEMIEKIAESLQFVPITSTSSLILSSL